METTQALSPLKKGEIIGGFVYLPFYLLFTQLLIALVLQLTGADLRSDEALFQLNFWNGLINLVAICLIFSRFLLGQLRSFQGSVGRVIGCIAIGYAIIYVGNLLINGVTLLLTEQGLDYFNANQDAVERFALANPLPSLLLIAVSAPVVEECLFRGLIFGLIHRRHRILAYAVSMLVFSFLHVLQPMLLGQPLYVTLVSLLAYLPMGFALAWVFERCRSLWGSIALHAFNNLLSVLALLLLNSVSSLAEQLPF